MFTKNSTREELEAMFNTITSDEVRNMALYVFMTLGKTEGRVSAANAIAQAVNSNNITEIKLTAFELGYGA